MYNCMFAFDEPHPLISAHGQMRCLSGLRINMYMPRGRRLRKATPNTGFAARCHTSISSSKGHVVALRACNNACVLMWQIDYVMHIRILCI